MLTLPTEIREALDVKEGDLVEFEVLGVVKRTRAKSPSSPSSDEPAPLGESA